MNAPWTTLKSMLLLLAALIVILPSVPAHAQSMDDAWQSVLRRWVGDGWKPFHDAGYNFSTNAGGKKWGAGLKAGVPVAFAAVCGNCTGVQLVLRDSTGNILTTANQQQGATSLSHTPKATGNGSIEIIPQGCRQAACPVRYTSFSRR